MQKKNILLTGATGIMGFEGLKQLLENESFNLTLLVRPGKKNRQKLKNYLNHERVKVIWGNLQSYEDILKAVQGMDIVLHVGGMVTPKADKYPELTMKVNVTSAENIVRAVKAQPNADEIKLVYIGSVAQLGSKSVPEHFSCSGNRMTPAQLDHYAVSKIMAEQIFAESGLKYWVSIRQTAILYPDLVKNGLNPILFHVPLKGTIEWITLEDTGRLLVKLCERDLPDKFWRKFYNVSSGNAFRMTNYEFESKLLKAIYCPPVEKIFEPNWFVTKNFHGCWYSDTDVLENELHYRGNTSCEAYFQNIIRKNVPWYFRLVKIVPSFLIKLVMHRLAHNKTAGPLHWIKSNDQEKISLYFGTREEWEAIPSWKDFDKSHPSEVCTLNNNKIPKPIEEWELDDMCELAFAYNGKCLAKSMSKGDINTPLLWENECGNSFYASPRYVVFGGFFPDGHLWQEIEDAKKLLVNRT